MRHELIPGHNVDKVNIEVGIEVLKKLGYTSENTTLLIEYCLNRWARGEEAAAQRMAIDKDFYGIDLTCWIRVLSAAIELTN